MEQQQGEGEEAADAAQASAGRRKRARMAATGGDGSPRSARPAPAVAAGPRQAGDQAEAEGPGGEPAAAGGSGGSGAQLAALQSQQGLGQAAASRNQALARLAVASSEQPGAAPLALEALLVEPGWRAALAPHFAKPYFKALNAFWQAEVQGRRKPVYPPRDMVFRALNTCPLDQVKVVILGQDPYHGPGQAMGLSFSVPRTCRPLPPSLLNIFKEAKADLGWAAMPAHGDLSGWATQGVLLLNASLSVRQGEANSHAGQGWEALTDGAVRELSQRGRRGVVFLLWGKSAAAKKDLIAGGRGHHVLTTVHPSPLSANRGFFGCKHFSKANQLLAAQGDVPIDWSAGVMAGS